MNRFSFPLLTAGDIQSHLRSSLQMSFVTEEDITKPKMDTIKMIYSKLLSLVDSNIDQESFKISEEDIDRLKYPDCHDVSIPTIRLFKDLNKLFLNIGCEDDPFRLSDIINPEFRRSRYYLSAFINFIKFSVEEFTVSLDKNENVIRGRVIREELRKTQDEYLKLQEEVSALSKFQKDNFAVLSQKNEQISELEIEKNRVIEERKKIEEKINLLRIEIDGTEQAISSLDQGLVDGKLIEASLSEKIVEKPEDYLNLLNEKKEKYQFSQQNKDFENNLSEETRNKLEKMEKIVSKLKEVGSLLETISLSKNKYEELCRTLESHKQERLKLERIIHEKKIQSDSVESQETIEKAKVDADARNLDLRNSSLLKSIDSKRSEFEYISKQNQDLRADLNEKQRNLENLVDQKEQLARTHEKVIQQFENEHKLMTDKAQFYSERIIQMLENADFLKHSKVNW